MHQTQAEFQLTKLKQIPIKETHGYVYKTFHNKNFLFLNPYSWFLLIAH